MITDADVKKLLTTFLKEFKKVFATKEDLKVLKDDILNEVDQKFEQSDSNLDKKLQNLREDISQDVSDLIGPYTEASDDHERRINNLEKHTSHPPVAS